MCRPGPGAGVVRRLFRGQAVLAAPGLLHRGPRVVPRPVPGRPRIGPARCPGTAGLLTPRGRDGRGRPRGVGHGDRRGRVPGPRVAVGASPDPGEHRSAAVGAGGVGGLGPDRDRFRSRRSRRTLGAARRRGGRSRVRRAATDQPAGAGTQVGGDRVGDTAGHGQHDGAGRGRGLQVCPAHGDVHPEGQRRGREPGQPPPEQSSQEHRQEQDRGHHFAVGDTRRRQHARDQQDDDCRRRRHHQPGVGCAQAGEPGGQGLPHRRKPRSRCGLDVPRADGSATRYHAPRVHGHSSPRGQR